MSEIKETELISTKEHPDMVTKFTETGLAECHISWVVSPELSIHLSCLGAIPKRIDPTSAYLSWTYQPLERTV